MNGFNSMVR